MINRTVKYVESVDDILPGWYECECRVMLHNHDNIEHMFPKRTFITTNDIISYILSKPTNTKKYIESVAHNFRKQLHSIENNILGGSLPVSLKIPPVTSKSPTLEYPSLSDIKVIKHLTECFGSTMDDIDIPYDYTILSDKDKYLSLIESCILYLNKLEIVQFQLCKLMQQFIIEYQKCNI